MGGIRPRPPRTRGRHFLLPRLAADLVRNAGVTRGDDVVDIGAGTGAITYELARRARSVAAIELDAELAAALRRRFSRVPNVRVDHDDALRAELPRTPFRVVANVPFDHTTAILRRLLDEPSRPIHRADLVVQWGTAVKRCSQRPSTLLTLKWSPWFELTITRRLSRSSFRPEPSVDAAVITITRRPDPLLACEERREFVEFLDRAFRAHPCARDLDVWEWTELYRKRVRAGR